LKCIERIARNKGGNFKGQLCISLVSNCELLQASLDLTLNST